MLFRSLAAVSCLANATFSAYASISANADVVCIGFKQGQEWSTVTPGVNVWTDVTAGATTWTDVPDDETTWTDITPGSNVWTTQNAGSTIWSNV